MGPIPIYLPMKKFIIILGIAIVFLAGSVWWSRSHTATNPIISTNGLHWHPELVIYVKGEKVEIPANVGLMGSENPIHTHTDLPLIHLEFQGMVRESNLKLGKFFQVWGKDFHEFGQTVHMTVNGVENIEYENYIMHDRDKIELRYE